MIEQPNILYRAYLQALAAIYTFICIKAPRYNSRLESILRQTGLIDSRMVGSADEGLEASRQLIDYSKVNAIMDEARKKSYEYLKNAIES